MCKICTNFCNFANFTGLQLYYPRELISEFVSSPQRKFPRGPSLSTKAPPPRRAESNWSQQRQRTHLPVNVPTIRPLCPPAGLSSKLCTTELARFAYKSMFASHSTVCIRKRENYHIKKCTLIFVIYVKILILITNCS